MISGWVLVVALLLGSGSSVTQIPMNSQKACLDSATQIKADYAKQGIPVAVSCIWTKWS